MGHRFQWKRKLVCFSHDMEDRRPVKVFRQQRKAVGLHLPLHPTPCYSWPYPSLRQQVHLSNQCCRLLIFHDHLAGLPDDGVSATPHTPFLRQQPPALAVASLRFPRLERGGHTPRKAEAAATVAKVAGLEVSGCWWWEGRSINTTLYFSLHCLHLGL